MNQGYDSNVTAIESSAVRPTFRPAPGPVRQPQRRRGAALEAAILEAAYLELTEVGYTAFTVESVAARGRTGKASIYRRWPSKPELVMDAMCAALPTAEQCGISLDVPDSVTTADALRQVARAITAILTSPAGDAMRSIKCEAAADPDLAALIDERFQAPRRAALLALLERGIRRGEVRPGAATPLVADVLPAVLTHRVILQRERVTERTIVDIIEQVLIPLVEAR
jgi:AcrR family transcriptional regulator